MLGHLVSEQFSILPFFPCCSSVCSNTFHLVTKQRQHNLLGQAMFKVHIVHCQMAKRINELCPACPHASNIVPFLLFLRFTSFASLVLPFFSSSDSPSLMVSLCLSNLCLYLDFLASSTSESELETSSCSFSSVTEGEKKTVQGLSLCHLDM